MVTASARPRFTSRKGQAGDLNWLYHGDDDRSAVRNSSWQQWEAIEDVVGLVTPLADHVQRSTYANWDLAPGQTAEYKSGYRVDDLA